MVVRHGTAPSGNIARFIDDAQRIDLRDVGSPLGGNIIIAGLYSRSGASFQITEAAVKNRLEYAISSLVALEYIGKIEDKVKDGLIDLPVQYYLRIVKAFIQNGIQIQRPFLNRPELPDNSDDKILECAIAGQCNTIITFNVRDLPKYT